MSSPANVDTLEPVQEVPMAAPVEAAPAEASPAAAGTKLVVQRGKKPNLEYPIYEGDNFLGRSDEQPVDIDLEDQETPEQVWSSRQHACIHVENGAMTLEDLKSSNGTYLNRIKLAPGEKKPLNVDDVIQIGTIHLKVKA